MQITSQELRKVEEMIIRAQPCCLLPQGFFRVMLDGWALVRLWSRAPRSLGHEKKEESSIIYYQVKQPHVVFSKVFQVRLGWWTRPVMAPFEGKWSDPLTVQMQFVVPRNYFSTIFRNSKTVCFRKGPSTSRRRRRVSNDTGVRAASSIDCRTIELVSGHRAVWLICPISYGAVVSLAWSPMLCMQF